MASAKQITTILKSLYANGSSGSSQTVYISGAPGAGKTSIAQQLATHLGIPQERVLLFRPSLRDPVDLMGVPTVEGNTTSFCPPAELWAFREGTGKGLILWDELPQGSPAMQNAIAGAMLDKVLGELRLDSDVIQIATGNRVQDKAGAGRIVSQLGNRVLHLEMEVSVDDWVHWAMSRIDMTLVSFLRFRPSLLSDFDPNRLSNPTPRSWEMVSNLPEELMTNDALYQYACSGLVGEGAAAEWVGARRIIAQMPDIRAVLAEPTTTPIPHEAVVKYAVTGALAEYANEKNGSACMQFMLRMPREFMALFMQDLRVRHNTVPEFITSSPEFKEWAVSSGL